MNFSNKRKQHTFFISNFFFTLTKSFVGVLFLFFSFNFSFSQNTSALSESKINSKIKEVEALIRDNKPESYFKGIDKLNNLENELLELNNSDVLCDFYIHISGVFLYRYDLFHALKYTNKGLKIAVQTKNNKKIGFFYENLGVIYNYYEKKDKRDDAFFMSKEYLTRYASLADQGDMYYNLSYISIEKKEWGKSLEYALKSDSITRFVKKAQSGTGLLLAIAECYVKLDNLEETRKYLDLISLSKDFNSKNIKALHRYYKVYSELLSLEGDEAGALKMQRISNDYNTLINKQNIRIINENLGIQNRMQLAVFNYEKLKKEAALKNQNLKYQRFILILATIIIFSLGLLLVLQIKASKYKSRVNVILKRKNEELKHAIAVKKRFLNTISHELRTPLNAIKSVVYLLKEKHKVDEVENLAILSSSTDYLLNLSNQIIEYNLLNENKYSKFVKKDTINLKVVCKEIIFSIEIIHHLNNNKVISTIDAAISESLFFDKNKLIMVLNSFIDNAFKFTNEGTIKLELKLLEETASSQKIRFVIQDTGLGMSEENIPKIFDLFYQGSEEINIKYGGSGIGLSIAKRILDLYPNNLKVTSKLNNGTTVSFELEFEKTGIVLSKEEEEKTTPFAIKRNTEILLVEDNKVNQLMICKILTNKGFKCDIAENGEEAVVKVKSKEYDLIIMDIMMPVMDGFEASKRIHELNSTIPIIALTALSEEYNQEKFKASKIKSVLNKPIDVEELCKTIKHSL
mgnify:CR=1 FL=1